MYGDVLSTSSYCHPELVSINDRHCVFVSYWNMSLTIGPLCTGLINDRLSLLELNPGNWQ